jgi:hypothetical protein
VDALERGEYDAALRLLRQNRLQTYFAFVSEVGVKAYGRQGATPNR